MSIKGNCIIGQSGGPTAAINASLSGVLQGVIASDAYDTAFGMVNGIEGLLQGKYLNLSEEFQTSEDLEKLSITPSMYLGSCRYKLPPCDEAPEIYENLFEFFKEHDIRTFFYIGGNDSMDTVVKLSTYAAKNNFPVNVIGVPKTIDNDLPITDHTPGFGSAAKFVATSLLEIAHDTYIYNIPSVTIVEIMGRNAGWLTAAASLARTEYSPAPDLIYLPEVPFDMVTFVADVKNVQKIRKNVIIAVSEGIKDKNNQYISASNSSVDAFGHSQLCGAAKTLEQHLKTTIGCKVRSIELNVLQRSSAHIASKTDLDEAIAIGKAAVTTAIQGETAKMMCYKRLQNSPYETKIISYAIEDIANKEKCIPREWITQGGNNVTQELIDYMLPLIQGETLLGYQDGVPSYCSNAHLYTKNFFEK